jgi:hypothetical protein
VKPINAHIKALANQTPYTEKQANCLNTPKSKKELELLQAQVKEQNKVTLDSIVTELEDARQIAKQSGNAAAMVSATLGKAKVLGLVVDKQETKAQVLNHNITVTFDE